MKFQSNKPANESVPFRNQANMTDSNMSIDDIWDANAFISEPIEACIHSLFKKIVLEKPSALAIRSKNGNLTFQELDLLSTKLAYHLVSRGLNARDKVVLCLNKSHLLPIAALGTMKAGGCLVALDATQPEALLHSIIAETSSSMVISTASSSPFLRRIADKSLVFIDDDLLSDSALSTLKPLPDLPTVTPSDAAYLFFSSGYAAGKEHQPTMEACIISHSSVCSAILYNHSVFGFKNTALVADSSPTGSYPAWCILLYTLLSGSCISIPDGCPKSESPSETLGSSLLQLSGYFPLAMAHVSLSCHKAELLRAMMPQLKPLTKSNMEDVVETPITIPNGIHAWIVDMNDPNSLLCPGYPGELYLEGPLVDTIGHNQYCHDSPYIIHDPAWLLEGSKSRPGRRGKVHATGLIVQYGRDAQLVCVGHCIRPENHTKFSRGRGTKDDSSSTEEDSGIIANVSEDDTDSSNRNTEATIDSTYDLVSTGESDSQKPTKLKSQLLSLWSKVLGLSFEEPGLTDANFFEQGGDVTKVLRLCRLAREEGIFLSIRDIFQNPTISQLASLDSSVATQHSDSIAPFTLLGARSNQEQAIVDAARVCRVHEAQIADILPCTPLQEGLLALTQRDYESYVGRYLFELDADVNTERLIRAWDMVVALNSILRTRIASIPDHGIVQVIIEEGVPFVFEITLQAYQSYSADDRQHMGLGTPLVRFGLVDDDKHSRRLFAWDIHHALYDGWSMPMIMKAVEQAYYYETPEVLQPMNGLIKYVKDLDDTAVKSFWKGQFTDIQGSHFPLIDDAATLLPPTGAQICLDMTEFTWSNCDYTPTMLIRAAWAMVTAHQANSEEALFGVTVTGRQAAVLGIEYMQGPAIATVPIRVATNWKNTATHLLDFIQRQAAEMIPYEQTGLQRIRSISQNAAIACNFQSLLVVQPADSGSSEQDGRPFMSAYELGNESAGTQDRDSGTYPIEAECQLGKSEVRLRIDYNTSIVTQDTMGIIVATFEHVLRKLTEGSHWQQSLRTLLPERKKEVIGLADIVSWNATVPEAAEQCVHEMITAAISRNPTKLAICAWNGSLTYQQLDDLSSTLAHELISKGVQGKLVPVLFEKSLWMPVSSLAVMKAGGALVALDMKLPEERLSGIVAQTDSPVILASGSTAPIASRLGTKDVLVVENVTQKLSFLLDAAAKTLPSPSPSSLLYVVFTSGTTGTPKGVMITHRNFCTAIKYQQQALHYNETCRVIDLASYAFDVAWNNMFFTLTAGACFCIPSATERDNDLPGCLQKYKVNFMDLTPSLARAIGSEALAKLETLILGGEASLPSDALLAGSKTNVVNAYGPAECTPTSHVTDLKLDSISIGRGMGVCTWVIDIDNPEELVSVGEVGELYLEGPLVGDGYINNIEKTNDAFIHDPKWLQQAVGRTGRVYRTGDLVRYREDGTVVYMGRKDTQVKIRGQRVELGEIESCITVLMEQHTVQVVVDVIRLAETSNPILTAFITVSDAKDMTEDVHKNAVAGITDNMSARLSSMLPSYMIPAAYFAIHDMPISATGKTDRRRLREIGSDMFLRQRDESSSTTQDDTTLNETEEILQKVWMSVLNLTAKVTSIDATFASLGGDSISAMQLVSQCRMHNVAFTVSDIFQTSTIRKLASRCRAVTVNDDYVDSDEDVPTLFDITPIQQAFFDTYPDGLNQYNQSFLLDMVNRVSVDALKTALAALVERHAMLRARFDKDPESGIWRQKVMKPSFESFAFVEHSVDRWDVLKNIAQSRQETFDITEGPVFACDLFNVANGNQAILFSAHHLVIDLVSWRIVWNDIEDHVKCGEFRSQPAVSYRRWCTRQARVGRNLSPLAVLPYSVPEPHLNFWGCSLEENTFGQVESLDASLPVEITKLLFGESNNSLRTEPVDLILAALFHSFMSTFSERELPPIWVEGHGREQSDELQADVSNTVGWFTTLYPLIVSPSSSPAIAHIVRLVKDTRRKIPAKGQLFYACQHYSQSGREAFSGHEIAEIVFNFTGRFQQLERDDGLVKQSQGIDDSDFKLCDISPSAKRSAIIEIDAGISENQLGINVMIPKETKCKARIQSWIRGFVDSLESLALALVQAPKEFTMADLPLLELSYAGLDTLLREQLPGMGINPDSITDIYPCTSLQEGMLLSLAKGVASYDTVTIARCLAGDNDSAVVSAHRLEAAWKQVARRHTILSSVFVLHPEGNGFLQIVLEDVPVRIRQLACGASSPSSVLEQLERPFFEANEPQHHLTICQSDHGDVAFRLDMAHMLNDAHSMSILLDELAAAYDGSALAEAPSFVQMISYIHSTPRAQTLKTWAALLDGVSPCDFPSSSSSLDNSVGEKFGEASRSVQFNTSIPDFCKKAEILSSSFMQVAWGMVLAHYTGKDDVCFGYMVSGRDALVDKVEALVGPLANLLVCRVGLGQTAKEVLKNTSKLAEQHLAMQHASLAEIQHHVGLSGQRLFNTSLTIRYQAAGEESKAKRGISFDLLGGEDAHEYDLKLSVAFNGDEVDLSIEFRDPYITRRAAEKVHETLTKAIEYLLQTEMAGSGAPDTEQAIDKAQCLSDTSVRDYVASAFFRKVVGAEQSDAISFWKSQFDGIQEAHFPALPSPSHTVRLEDEISLNAGDLALHGDKQTVDTVARAAWAILTARIMSADESVFGVSWSAGVEILALPVRIPLNWDETVHGFLDSVRQQTVQMDKYRRMGVGVIRGLGEEAALACKFQTILTYNSSAERQIILGATAAAVVINVQQENENTTTQITMSFDSQVIEKARATRIIHEFEHVIRQLVDMSRRQEKLRDISVASTQDLHDVWTWNTTVPETVEGCIHDLIVQQCKEQPDADAVSAWDGDFSYRQLDELSTSLAHRLILAGVGRGSIVPLCFEKSKWVPIAVLAVMKAGGASVAVDTSLPEERIQSITSQVFTDMTRPKVIMSSVANDALVMRLGPDEMLIVSDESQLTQSSTQQTLAELELPSVSPSDLLYIVFTSGSTGQPKGVMITHQHFCSAIKHQSDMMGLGRSSRVYDFASYAFDAAWMNLLNTLPKGGCICIPSASEREDDLGRSMLKYRANVADLTPSVARIVEPRSVLSTLDVLILAGEAVIQSDCDLVGENTRVIVAYGPSECTPSSTYFDFSKRRDPGIGWGLGACTWIVDTENPDALAPVGACGELWIEGPVVGLGYLHHPARTAQSFVENPSWLSRGSPDGVKPGRTGRVYRTGDLVRYNEDGFIVFIGRKDTQVKIRGQRVELGDIEHHVQQAFEEVTSQRVQVVAEPAHVAGITDKVVVAFVCLDDAPEDHEQSVRQASSHATEHLAKILPGYMLPSIYVSLRTIPMTVSHKVDRRRLQALVSKLTIRDIANLTGSSEKKEPPQTPAEHAMQALWASILSIEPETISINDSFFRIGGDSIGAMRLVAAARQRGFSLTVREIFEQPILRYLCVAGDSNGSSSDAPGQGDKQTIVTISYAQKEKVVADSKTISISVAA